MSKLDFVISSDSEQSEKDEKTYHPTYIRINEKINDLKQKVIAQLGRNRYIEFLNYAQANALKADRAKVIEMVGEQNVGIWQIAQNISKLGRVLAKIPMYVQ